MNIVRFFLSPVGLSILGAIAIIGVGAWVYHAGQDSVTGKIAIDANKQKDKASHERAVTDETTRSLSDDKLLECVRTPSKC